MADIPLNQQLHGFIDDLERTLDCGPGEPIDCDDIILCGVGGSAVSGDVAADCYRLRSEKPIRLVKNPDLPNWAGPRTLAVVSSYSGNTAETLEMYRQARERGCRVVAVTSGGKLGDLAAANGDRLMPLPRSMQPRHAIGYMIGYTLAIIRDTGAPDLSDEIRSFLPALRAYRDENVMPDACLARTIAETFIGKVPVVCSGPSMRSVAFRWKTQINENSKYVAFFDSVPGFMHAGLESWRSTARRNCLLLLLIGCDEGRADLEMAERELKDAGAPFMAVRLGGSTPLEDMFRAIVLGDYVSMYMAQIRGIDPAEVRPVMQMKAKLSERTGCRSASRKLLQGVVELADEPLRTLLGDGGVLRFGVYPVFRLGAGRSEQDPPVVVYQLQAVGAVDPRVPVARCDRLGHLLLQLLGALHGLLDGRVRREGIDLLIEVSVPDDAFEHPCGAHGAVPAELVVGEYQSAVLLPAEDGAVGGHLARHYRGAHGGVDDLPSCGGDSVLDDPRGGHGDDNSPLPAVQEVPSEDGQRLVPRHIPSGCRGEDYPVRIAVVGDADVGSGLLHCLQKLLQVVLGGLAEVPRMSHVRISVDHDGRDTEPLQQHRGCGAGASVGAVQDGFDPRLADRIGIDLGDDGADVLLSSTIHAGRRADLLPSDGRGTGMVCGLDLVLLLLCALGSVAGDALDAVELGRIVGCGYHHPADHVVAHLDPVLQRGCRYHSEVEDVGSDGHQPRAEGVLEHLR